MKRILTSILVIAAAAALAVSAAAAPASTHRVKTTKLTIVMHDPGCHWFAVGKAFKLSASVTGDALVQNFDQAALIVKGPAGYSGNIAVGKSLKVTAPGTYHITMVKQASDDNHLVLHVTR